MFVYDSAVVQTQAAEGEPRRTDPIISAQAEFHRFTG